MSDIAKALNNIRTLRAQARELPLETLEELLEKLTSVVAERREETETEEAANRERQEKLDKFRTMLLDEGIDPSELMDANSTKPRKKRDARPAKYRCIDENGVERLWTGQGRTPSAIKAELDKGKTLDDFLIA